MSKIVIIILYLIVSSHANAEWTYFIKSEGGTKVYIDYDRISKNNGFIYFWRLDNLLEPLASNTMSIIGYQKVNCDSPRKFMILQLRGTDQHFGEGNSISSWSPTKGWEYPPPESIMEILLDEVCIH